MCRVGILLFMGLVSNALSQSFVDVVIREEAQILYQTDFVQSEPAMNWTSDSPTCNEGTTSQSYRDAIFDQVNYFRDHAGFLPVSESATYSAKAQKAALMMSVNNQLSHSPSNTWTCYSADGAEAASKADLFLGVNGIESMEGYMHDPGAFNNRVGHRNWILRRDTLTMGTGDVPANAGHSKANALWVVTPEYSIRAMRDPYTAWPPANGFSPHQVVYPRWSFKMEGADLSSATVSMTMEDGTSVGVSMDYQPTGSWYPLVWIPTIPSSDYYAPRTAPATDEWYRVSISNVMIGASLTSVHYTVVIFDPARDTDEDVSPTMMTTSILNNAQFSWRTPSDDAWNVQTSTDLVTWSNYNGQVSFDGFICSVSPGILDPQRYFRVQRDN